MKETKVYVDELPKCCWDCFCQDNENGRCKILGKYTDYVPKDCPLIDIKTHDRELFNENRKKIVEYIEQLAWEDVQYDAFQSTIGEFSGSTSAIPRYAKKYLKLWKEMFNEDLEEIQKLEAEDEQI